MFKVLVSAIAYDKLNRQINWKRSKRLLSGALLVLTSTSLKDFIYAQVQDRPEENKSENRCYFTIKILNIDPDDYIEKLNKYLATNDQLIILENTVFFDIYQFYLGCLQNKITDNYPFQQQITFNSQETPKQYTQIDIPSLTYLLNNLFIKYHKQQKTLDSSQQKAIQIILNNKISLIQGPPGTGKTFCGALAVNLLHIILQESCGRPIIIICQTNHALDQFLEHILQFCGMYSVVRIGGRCKNKSFEPILLQTIRQNRQIHFDWPNLYRTRDKTNNLLSKALRTVDNVHYKDVQQHLPDLVKRIIDEYLKTQNVQFKKEISYQSKQIIVHMWLDCYKPRKQQLEKIIEIETEYNNSLIKSDNYKQNFKDINLNIDSQKQIQIQEYRQIYFQNMFSNYKRRSKLMMQMKIKYLIRMRRRIEKYMSKQIKIIKTFQNLLMKNQVRKDKQIDQFTVQSNTMKHLIKYIKKIYKSGICHKIKEMLFNNISLKINYSRFSHKIILI